MSGSDAAGWTVCGLAGSLRTNSYNRSLLRAARELAPAGMDLVIFDRVVEIPLFNEDVESEGDPDAVEALKAAIHGADGLLIVTPEYNAGPSGVIKNALDWASRRYGDGRPVLSGKPTAVMGATPGLLGTARAQAQLRMSLAGTGALVMARPQVHVVGARQRFSDGELVDADTRRHVAGLLEAFGDWIARVRS